MLPLQKFVRRDLLILWLAIAAVSLVLVWLLLVLGRQGAGPQIARARHVAAVSCEALQAGAARLWRGAPAADGTIAPSAAQAVLDLALRDQAGVEGGFWEPGAGIVAYAFPTYDGTGIKRDPPSAELERITVTAQRALDADAPVVDLRPGLREAVVFAACPPDAGSRGLIAWTLLRVPLIGAEVVNPLLLAVSLLLGLVIASGAWLGWTLSRWRQQSAQLQMQLAQAERLATLGRMSAGLAHEIRNPLGTMRMKAENALAAPPEMRAGRAAGALEVVLSQTQRLEALVSSLLALTQPFVVERRGIGLRSWLEARIQAHAGHGGARLALTLDPALAGDADATLFDPEQMARAVDNLLLNALAHTGAGGRIELGARRTAQGTLLLWVADDGKGVPADLRDTLFEPFTTARAGGTGLGLALVKEIVQAHGGQVRLAATVTGTCIEMELPWPAS